MTPKEKYEARKAERIASRDEIKREPIWVRGTDGPDKDERIEDMFDRFVTAVERIADALERPSHDTTRP